jgi:hypothetical protein
MLLAEHLGLVLSKPGIVVISQAVLRS